MLTKKTILSMSLEVSERAPDVFFTSAGVTNSLTVPFGGQDRA